MSLKPVLGGCEGIAGQQEKIQMSPAGDDTVNRIISIFYGKDDSGEPIAVPLDPSGNSFTIEVKSGTVLLQVLFQSSVDDFHTLVADQDPIPPNPNRNVLQKTIPIMDGVGDWSPQITGKAAPADAGDAAGNS